ncbi:unnamed protein product, partial [Rotaria magnacalcarata]
DSITTGQQQYRREISGFVNNHRPVPPITSSTPPGRSSITTEQQLISVAQRPSLSKQAPIINNENGEISSPNKRSSIGENILPISPALKPFINKTTDETNIDDNKTRTIPIIHEYRSPTTTLTSRANPSTFYSMNQQIAGIPRLIGSVSLPPTSLSTHFPTSLSSTMIISPLHDRAFFICKELLMTERTYKKDIEVVADNFRRELMLIINEQNDIYLDQDEQQQQQKNLEKDSLLNLSDLLFTHLVPIYNFHVHFLRQLEQRISLWENRSIPGNEYGSGETTHQHIGDLITNLVEILP